jgi:hypothetical protein
MSEVDDDSQANLNQQYKADAKRPIDDPPVDKIEHCVS